MRRIRIHLLNFAYNGLQVSTKIMVVLSVMVTMFLVVSAMDTVTAAEGASGESTRTCIDVTGTYEEAQAISEGTTGVATSIDSLKRNDFTASTLLYAGLLFGSDVYCQEVDREAVSVSTRNGILTTVNMSVYSLLYNPPGVDIPGHIGQQFIPGYGGEVGDTAVYAQSDGYAFLSQQLRLEPVWALFRNISYAGFVLVIMVIGFAVMFRTKIKGSVTVTIMNSIPNVATGLVLTTFSFAIVGFILDIGRFLMILLENSMNTALSGQGFQAVGLSGILGMFNDAFTTAYPNGYLNFGIGSGLWIAGEGMEYLDSPIAGDIAAPIGAGMKWTGLTMMVLAIVVAVVCLYAAVRLFMTIVITYLKIVLDLILGPIYILLGTLPGNTGSISGWIKRVFSHALSFVVMFLIINLVTYLAIGNALDAPLTFFNSSDFISDAIVSMRGVFVIAGYLLAAGAPGIVEDMLDVKASKGISGAMEGAKKAASKMPVVGGLFGS